MGMKKFKENLKKHWKVSLGVCAAIVCVLCIVSVIVAGSNQKSEKEAGMAYTVEVKNSKGMSVEEVYVVLCAKDGKEITWLPYVTGTGGTLQFTEGIEEGCYVKIVGVPTGYKLDTSMKYSFDEKGRATVVLGDDDSVYIAKIDDSLYTSFATALGAANASSKDVIIELLADVTIKTGTINNTYGKTITIRGNGRTLTTEGGNNALEIKQEKGIVELENMTIKHKNTGAVCQIATLATVNLTDVTIDATEGAAYNYCLINTLATDGTTTLNLTRVNAKMAIKSSGKDEYAAIIRTGNASGTKTVTMNLTDCNFDTTEATGRHGIVVMKNTVANINMTNSVIRTGDAYAVYAVEQSKEQTLTANGCQMIATSGSYAASPLKGYAAQIGNTYYLTLEHAAKAANVSAKDITIKVVTSTTMKTCTIHNTNGKLVTIDGNGKTITTSGGNNAFVVGKNVALKNMTIHHKNTGSIVQAQAAADISLTDVEINASGGTAYNYALFNLLAKEETSVLKLTRVNVKMAVESKGNDSYASIIRTGNDGEAKTVIIDLTDCSLDTTGATKRSGIAIMKGTTATVSLTNTKIATKDTFAIRSNEQDISLNNVTLTSCSETYQTYPIEGYPAKIGDKFYTFAQAVAAANAATSDTEIKLLADYSINTYTVNNKNGKKILMNGNGKTITTSGGNNAFVVGGRTAFENMSINHKNGGSVIQVTSAGTVDLKNVTINATEGKAYNYSLVNLMAKGDKTTLNMDHVSVTMSVAGRGKDSDSAIIRTGNNEAKRVDINLTDCNFDMTQATGRSGIVVMKETVADVNLTNTVMKTLDAAVIKSNDNSNSQSIKMTGCTLDSVTKEFKKSPIRGYEAQIGDRVYLLLEDALEAANNATEDVTVQFVQDFTRGKTYSINNENGKAVTIDGKGYVMTTQGGKNTFQINAAQTGNVVFKNMTIQHKNERAVIQVKAGTTVSLIDMKIEAVEGEIHDYALINVEATGKTATLNLDGVDVRMSAEKSQKDGPSIIRTGNDGDAKKVYINLVNSKLNAVDASDRNGILITKDTEAVIDMNNTQIKTMGASALCSVKGAKGQAKIAGNSELISGNAKEQEGYAIRIGDTWYVDYGSSLLEAAKNATEDITITLTEDMEIDLTGLQNVNGKTITIDTNGCVLTTTGTKSSSVVILSQAQVRGENETRYLGFEKAVDVANNAAEDVTIELFSENEVYLTNVKNVNGKKITINTNGHCLTTTGTRWSDVEILSEAQCELDNKTMYLNFTEALAQAKTSNEDVVITLLSDITVKEGTKIENNSGKAITIDGNNKACTVTTNKNGFDINYKGRVCFKDMNIQHVQTQSAIKVAKAAEVSLENVTIHAISSNYQYGLINVLATTTGEEVITLNMNQVDIKMDVVTGTGTYEHSIIRTGNDNDGAKRVDICLENCTFDAAGSSKVMGIRVGKTTDAHITATDSAIITKDIQPIYDCSENASISKTRCALSISDIAASGEQAVQVGNTLYETFMDALKAANAATKAVTMELLSDIEITSQNVYIGNANGDIIVDGNGHTLTTAGGKDSGKDNNAFPINKASTVEFKNMTIVHKHRGSIIQTNSANSTLNLSDVTINATNPDNSAGNYNYALINLTADSTLNLTRVNVDMDVSKAGAGGGKQSAIIRTGNSDNKDTYKQVTINLTDCTLDATGAAGRSGILIVDAKADINLRSTTILTQNETYCAAIQGCQINGSDVRRAAISMNENCMLKTGDSTEQSETIKNIERDEITVVEDNTANITSASEKKETKTKTVILEVPVKLYNAFVDWIKQFAAKNQWDLDL